MLSPARLHPPVLKTAAHRALAAKNLTSLVEARNKSFANLAYVPPSKPWLSIPLTTVSAAYNFDALINIRFRNGRSNNSPCAWADVGLPGNPAPCLLVDLGNTPLVVPDFDCIQKLSDFAQNYKILAETACEPFHCPAKILRGPIEIPTPSGVFEIPDCVFYACTGPNKKGERTANFGLGWISNGWPTGVSSIPSIHAPLTYCAYPLVEIDYAPASAMLTASDEPILAEGSSLTVHKTMPTDYKTVFELVRDPDCSWMSLRPFSLSIGDTKTKWPPDPKSSIAMIDTGGGPVFLSDPNGCIYEKEWPEPVDCPFGPTDGSNSCQAVKDPLQIEIGSTENNRFSYRIDTSSFPESVQGLTLVMCKECSYMMGQKGMNIGGISALFLKLVIDYAHGTVGFKGKQLQLT